MTNNNQVYFYGGIMELNEALEMIGEGATKKDLFQLIKSNPEDVHFYNEAAQQQQQEIPKQQINFSMEEDTFEEEEDKPMCTDIGLMSSQEKNYFIIHLRRVVDKDKYNVDLKQNLIIYNKAMITERDIFSIQQVEKGLVKEFRSLNGITRNVTRKTCKSIFGVTGNILNIGASIAATALEEGIIAKDSFTNRLNNSKRVTNSILQDQDIIRTGSTSVGGSKFTQF